MIDTPAPAPGLRETKKARTRQAISDVATRLFVEHGYDNVTVAQIAAAADVSIKTVFNYFPAKEDLFFDRAEELIAGLERTIAERPDGVGVTAALHVLLADNHVPFPGLGWAVLRNPERYAGFRGFVATEQAAPALRARRLVLGESWVPRLAAAVAAAWELDADDPRVRAYAAMLNGILGVRERTLSAAVLDGLGARTIERRVRGVVDEAFARLAIAFADVDR